MGFRDIPQPFVCGVLVDDATVDGVTRTMKLAEYEGADVFDFELQSLDPELRNPAALRPVFEATTLRAVDEQTRRNARPQPRPDVSDVQERAVVWPSVGPGPGPTHAPRPIVVPGIRWRGELPLQKWMNFYTKVLSRFAHTPGVILRVEFEVPPGNGVTDTKVEETKAALRELGLNETVEQA
jgi:hypothetical protein